MTDVMPYVMPFDLVDPKDILPVECKFYAANGTVIEIQFISMFYFAKFTERHRKNIIIHSAKIATKGKKQLKHPTWCRY